MNREEFGDYLRSKNVKVVEVEQPLISIDVAGQSVIVEMRSYRTHNIKELQDFLVKAASVVFLYKVEQLANNFVVRGNYITG